MIDYVLPIVLYVIPAIICCHVLIHMCKSDQGHVTIGDLCWIFLLSLTPLANGITLIIFVIMHLEDKYGEKFKKFFDRKVL